MQTKKTHKKKGKTKYVRYETEEGCIFPTQDSFNLWFNALSIQNSLGEAVEAKDEKLILQYLQIARNCKFLLFFNFLFVCCESLNTHTHTL